MQEQQNKKINIVSYNIHHGANIQDVYNIQKIISTINTLKPNIVCLQEVDNNYSERSLNQHQPQIFMQQIEGITQNKFTPTIDDTYGLQILTQDNILDYHSLILKTGLKEDRTFQYVKLQNGLQIIHLHLSQNEEQQKLRIQQIQSIFDHLESKKIDLSAKTIICGDFNEDCDDSKDKINETLFGLLQKKKFQNAKQIYEQSEDRIQEKQQLFTFSRKQYNKNIDHFYVTNDIKVELFKIIESDASDHNPILLSVQI